MTISAEFQKHNKLGAGLILPLKSEKLTFPEIICEARNLSEAEGKNSRTFIKGNKKKWCVILHWANPELKKESEKWNHFQSCWTEQYDPKIQTVRDEFKCKCEDQPVFDDNGELQLRWTNEINDFDLILTTQPKPTDCFSAESLANMFFRKPEYFIKNRLNGFETIDDEGIIQLLNHMNREELKKHARVNCTENEVSDFIEIMKNV